MNEGFSRILGRAEMSVVNEFRKEILAFLILLSLSFFFYDAVYLRNVENLRVLDGKAAQVRSDMERIKMEILTTDALRKKLEQLSSMLGRSEDKFERIKRRFPTEKHMSGILTELSLNEVSDRRIVSIKPLPSEDKGEFMKMPFEIRMETNFIPAGGYIERLEELERIMFLDNFNINLKEDNSGVLSVNLYLSAYVLKED